MEESIRNRVFSSFVSIIQHEESIMQLYFYDGPVLEFDRIIAEHWSASTRAETEKKARNNLAYQFKKQYGREARSKISVPGKLIIKGGETYNG